MKAANKISILIALILLGIGFCVSVVAIVITKGDFTEFESETLVENSYTVKDTFKNIDIDVESADVAFTLSENGECFVVCKEEKSEKITHTVAVQDNTLIVKLTDRRKWYEHIGISVYSENMTVTVYLPQTEYENLIINTVSSEVNVPDNFSFNAAEVRTTSGDVNFGANVKDNFISKTVSGSIEISGVKPNEMLIKSTSGDITLKTVEAEKLSVKSVSGEVLLSEAKCGSLIAGTTSGEVTLNRVLAKEINCKTVSGEIKLSSCDADTLKLTTTSGDVEGSLLSDKVFVTHTASGDVDVPRTTAGGVCEINTVSGDIEIEIES